MEEEVLYKESGKRSCTYSQGRGRFCTYSQEGRGYVHTVWEEEVLYAVWIEGGGYVHTIRENPLSILSGKGGCFTHSLGAGSFFAYSQRRG